MSPLNPEFHIHVRDLAHLRVFYGVVLACAGAGAGAGKVVEYERDDGLAVRFRVGIDMDVGQAAVYVWLVAHGVRVARDGAGVEVWGDEKEKKEKKEKERVGAAEKDDHKYGGDEEKVGLLIAIDDGQIGGGVHKTEAESRVVLTRRTGMGAHIVLPASTRSRVDAFYKDAIALGGRSISPPTLSPNDRGKHYYNAVVEDPEGNTLEIACNNETLTRTRLFLRALGCGVAFMWPIVLFVVIMIRIIRDGEGAEGHVGGESGGEY